MRSAGKALLVAGVVAALGVAGTVYAYADGWTIEGRTSLTVRVAKMPRGVEPSVARQSGRAVVSWSAQELAPGVRMDHYVVTAHSVSEPPRPDVTHTVAAAGAATESVTFPAPEVAGGGWRWSVVPRYLNWAGEPGRLSGRVTFPALSAAAASAGPSAAPGLPPEQAPQPPPASASSPPPPAPQQSRPAPSPSTEVPSKAVPPKAVPSKAVPPKAVPEKAAPDRTTDDPGPASSPPAASDPTQPGTDAAATD
ncbi:hypothetical protein [Actinoplanes sp. DH11]|uniref:hypothetical protein n=1 Tax=Actinoplanes sp. DH11 TaxID=2857011 RepID=UPI001E344EFF|nr:hypothetical protein [Actinoplanes sp. DH11]